MIDKCYICMRYHINSKILNSLACYIFEPEIVFLLVFFELFISLFYMKHVRNFKHCMDFSNRFIVILHFENSIFTSKFGASYI